jgi:ABC-type branched-subunit amino acid transport system ATPase component
MTPAASASEAAMVREGGVIAADGILFEAVGLHKSFGGVRAVRDVSVKIPASGVFAIIGPNGAGKSTLLNLMSGLYQPDAGTMRFDGIDLVGLPAHRRVRLGLARTFQKIRLFRQLSVLDNIVAGFHVHHAIPAWQYVVHAGAFARDHARCRDEALALLAFVGLERRASVPAASLAYGEQRMLELARALATGPRLAEVEKLLDRIAALRARHVAVVVVEHNMDLVMQVADRVLVMDYGQVLFEGSPVEVQKSPAVIAAYLGA